MSSLKTASGLSNQRWIDSIPADIEDLVSNDFDRRISKNVKRAKFISYKTIIKLVAVAVVLITLLTGSFAVASKGSSDFKIKNGIYYAAELDNAEEIIISIDYIPDNCNLIDTEITENTAIMKYDRFTVERFYNLNSIDMKTNNYTVKKAGIKTYIIYTQNKQVNIIWNDGSSILHICGSLGADELLKTAKSVK
ncbi:MAG: DUF4367 domain-containing protein [Eubacterium sp.]